MDYITTNMRGLVEVLKATAKHQSSFTLGVDGDDILITGTVSEGMRAINRANTLRVKKPGKVSSGVVGVFYAQGHWSASGTCKGHERLWKYFDHAADAVVARLSWEQKVGIRKDHDFERFCEYVKAVEQKEDVR